MELYQEILENTLLSGVNSAIKDCAAQIVDLESYKALKQIKDILEDCTLSDETCFNKIEKIVCTFEHIGSGGGFRHDF